MAAIMHARERGSMDEGWRIEEPQEKTSVMIGGVGDWLLRESECGDALLRLGLALQLLLPLG